ncbi:MAG: hypothetical protein JST54_25940 [Deltaproteobacteria bacterium]|nr:hypothetical protein [Deltaproteobacteria bacterium]
MIVQTVRMAGPQLDRGYLRLFRGISRSGDPLAHQGIIAARRPLHGFNEWVAAAASRTTIGHVRSQLTDHARSFTVLPDVACYFATSAGRQDGLVAVWDIEIVHTWSFGCSLPYFATTACGASIIDPRTLPDFTANSPLVSQEVRNFARVDGEILLFGGVARVQIVRVRAGDCPAASEYLPYEKWGQRFVSLGGTWVPTTWLR